MASERKIYEQATALTGPQTTKSGVSTNTRILAFDGAGERIGGPFESVTLGSSLGLAVVGAAGAVNVYASDLESGTTKVFGAVTVPDVKACGAREVTSTGATLQGEVDPLGSAGATTVSIRSQSVVWVIHRTH